MAKHLIAGKLAEDLALKHLQSHTLRLIARNWLSPYGEIDLIMQDHKTLVFIEVRYRQKTDWGHPLETINQTKQHKIIKTAQLFLQKNQQWLISPCRFDVISITNSLNDHPHIEWLNNAFSMN